jgi:hypothetical protein
MGFWDALWELMLGDAGRMPAAFHGSGILVFAASSALMGVIAVALDWVLFSVRGRSVFDLSYAEGPPEMRSA